jgi:hypothetical protein
VDNNVLDLGMNRSGFVHTLPSGRLNTSIQTSKGVSFLCVSLKVLKTITTTNTNIYHPNMAIVISSHEENRHAPWPWQ